MFDFDKDNVTQSLEQPENQVDQIENFSSHTETSDPPSDEKKFDFDINEKDEWRYPVDPETGLRLVYFVEGDKHNPKNCSLLRKWVYTAVLGFACFIVAFGSAVVTGGLERPMAYFGVSKEVIVLASVTMFVIGFGVGPLLFAPLSEEVGRKTIYTITLFLAVIFIIPCGLAKNIGTLIVCRLIDGILFSAPMTLIGGSLADIWEGPERGFAMAIFSSATYLGPVMGPIFGGLLGDNAPTWRWIYWTFLILSGFMYALLTLVVPETYGPAILRSRANKLTKLTGDKRYKCQADLVSQSFLSKLQVSVLRPFALLSELIVFLITIYMSVNYGLLYMFFLAYPIVYMEGKGWSESKTGIMFIPIGVGVLLSIPFALYFNKDYNKRAQKYRDRGELPPPELRLVPMMISCWILPASLFAWGWSSYPRVSWAGPCFSGLGAGFAFTALYNPGNNYLVDSYQHYAASALAAKTFVRSMWGAGVVLFTTQMYHKLGYEWATSLMAFISLACCLIPFLFYRYGKAIRRFSRYAYSPEMD